MPSSSDRVVVGAGVSGLAIARELAPEYDVLVLDKGGVAADTSSRASGMISLSLEPFPDGWVEFALDRFRALDGRGVFSFTERETVRLVPESDAERYTDEAPDGLVVVAGLHGRGVMLSPDVGRAVRSLVTGEEAPFPTAAVELARFDDRSADFEYRSHWQ